MAGTKEGARKQREKYGETFFSDNAKKANQIPRSRGFDNAITAKLAAYKSHRRRDPEKYDPLIAALELQREKH